MGLFKSASLMAGLLSVVHGLDISGRVQELGGASLAQARICIGTDTSACVLSGSDGSFRLTRLATRIGPAPEMPDEPKSRAGFHRTPIGMVVETGPHISDLAGRRIELRLGAAGSEQGPVYRGQAARTAAAGPDTLFVSKADFLTRAYVPVAETESSVVITLDRPLTPPAGLNVSAALNALSISWNPVAGAASYSLYFKTGSGIGKGDARVDEATSPYSLRDLVDGKTYAIGIEARNSSTASELSTSVSPPFRASLAYLGKRGLSQGGALNTEVAVGRSGIAYMGYRDLANGHKATVSKFNGTGWESLGSAGFTPDTAYHLHMALDSNDRPWLAYAHGGRVSVMRYTGSAWDTVGPQKLTGRDVLQPKIALSGKDTVFLAFIEADSNRRLSVMKFDGGAWVAVGAMGFTGGISDSPALAVDRNGVPHVAYWERCPDLLNPPAKQGRLSAMKWNGAAWDSIGRCMTTGNNTGANGPPSMKFDTSGALYVGFSDEANGGKATVLCYRGSAWSTVGNAGFTAGVAASLTLAIGPSGQPYIAYSNSQVEGRADVMRLEGSIWKHAPNPDFSSGAVTGTTVSINSLGETIVGFTDYSTPGGKASAARIRFE